MSMEKPKFLFEKSGFFTTPPSLRISSAKCWNGNIYEPMPLYHDIAGKQAETKIPLLKNNTPLFDQKFTKKRRQKFLSSFSLYLLLTQPLSKALTTT